MGFFKNTLQFHWPKFGAKSNCGKPKNAVYFLSGFFLFSYLFVLFFCNFFKALLVLFKANFPVFLL